MWTTSFLVDALLAAPEEAQAIIEAGAETTEGTQQTASGAFSSMVPMLIALFAITYFLMIRPQKQQQKKRREMLDSLQRGARIITTGGIHGTIFDLSESSVVVKVGKDESQKMEFSRGAIAQVISENDAK